MTPAKHSAGGSVCRRCGPVRLVQSRLDHEAQAFVQRVQASTGHLCIRPRFLDQSQILFDAGQQLGRELRDRARSTSLTGNDKGNKRLGEDNKPDVAHNLSVTRITTGHGVAFARAVKLIVRKPDVESCRAGSLPTSVAERILLIPRQQIGLIRVCKRVLTTPRPAGEAQS